MITFTFEYIFLSYLSHKQMDCFVCYNFNFSGLPHCFWFHIPPVRLHALAIKKILRKVGKYRCYLLRIWLSVFGKCRSGGANSLRNNKNSKCGLEWRRKPSLEWQQLKGRIWEDEQTHSGITVTQRKSMSGRAYSLRNNRNFKLDYDKKSIFTQE